MIRYESVDAWLAERTIWHDEFVALRQIVLDAGLTETVKWGQPCYTDNDRNILIVSHRTESATVSFLRGVLLDDPAGRLESPGENSRSVLYMRFTSVAQVHEERAYVEALLKQAVEVARSGQKVEPLPDEIDYCDELQQRLEGDEAFCAAFEALTPGRRRAYNMHFSQAKAAATRETRIDRATERIMAGKGPQDCICGFSKRMPRCDGSHKNHPRETWAALIPQTPARG